jgi:hypothetical protein
LPVFEDLLFLRGGQTGNKCGVEYLRRLTRKLVWRKTKKVPKIGTLDSLTHQSFDLTSRSLSFLGIIQTGGFAVCALSGVLESTADILEWLGSHW